MKTCLVIYICLLMGGISYANKILNSPDKKVQASVYSDANRILSYTLSFNGQEVLRKSAMGIIVDHDTLGLNSVLELIKEEMIIEEYKTRGFHVKAINHCVQYTYSVTSTKRKWLLQVRIYNDGFAFRYCVPDVQMQTVEQEITSFLPYNANKVWFFERNNDWKLKTYAGEWISTSPDSLWRISAIGPVQGAPLLFKLNSKGYMLLTEAALYNYSGMRFEAQENNSLIVNFTETNGFKVDGDIVTPWRTVILANNLNDLVNSDLVTNLNPCPDSQLFADCSWIKYGRSVWSWWSNPVDYMDVDAEKHFIDRANELGFEYTTLDEGWESWPEKWKTLKAICEYANQKKVGVWVWKHSDELNLPENNYYVMQMFLDSLQQVGVKGVKIDFMNGESKSVIDFDIRALELAAKRKLLVNFHGCQKPSGEFRHYPNEMTREGIRGLELNRMNQFISASHNVALVFTRCALNNADYTPIGFSNPGHTTYTHQLATAYAFTSPLMTLAEHPDSLFLNLEIAQILPFIKEIPSVWDETIVLEGSSVDSCAILARRFGENWYLVVLNDEKKRSLDISLSEFLSHGEWSMKAVEDVKGMCKRMNLSEKNISYYDKLHIVLNQGGGFLAKFTNRHEGEK